MLFIILFQCMRHFILNKDSSDVLLPVLLTTKFSEHFHIYL